MAAGFLGAEATTGKNIWFGTR